MKDYINHKPQVDIHWTDKARLISELSIIVFGFILVGYLLIGAING